MRFRVEREALAEALAWVARALPTRPVVPVLSGLRLDAGSGLTLSCFDYEVAATAQIEADVLEPGTVIVPGRLLAEITRSLPALAVDVATDADGVSVTCGSAEFTLVELPAEEYPALPVPPAVAGTVDGGVLGAAIGQVVPAASRDDTLPMLTGVCLDIDGATLTLAATDRYRLAVQDLTWEPVRAGLRAAALVPARTLADAARAMTPGVPVSIAFETGPAEPRAAKSRAGEPKTAEPRAGEPKPAQGMISFGIGGRRLTVRMIGGEFIRYRSRFPSEFGCQADVPSGPFTEAVRRVSLVADRTSPVRLSFSPGKVVIEAQTEGRARAVETVPAEYHGEEPGIAFNPHYLLDGLTAAAAPAPGPGQAQAGGGVDASRPDTKDAGRGADGGATSTDPGLLRIEFTSPAKPALITRVPPEPAHDDPAGAGSPAAGAEPPGFRYLVVPLRAVARS
jgi:DNA polymerase-3 subunit beta